MPSRKVALAQRWFQEVWVRGNDAVIEEIFGRDCVLHHQAQGKTYRGPAGFRKLYRQVNRVVEDIECDFHQTIEQGDTIAIHWTFSGLPRSGPGQKPARRKKMQFGVVTIIRIAGGQFVEAWDTFDAARLNELLSTTG